MGGHCPKAHHLPAVRTMRSSVLDTAQSINFFVYTAFGFWQINSKNRAVRILYNIYSIFVVAMVTLYTVLQITDLKDAWGDVEEFSNNLSATSTSIFSLSKVYILRCKMKSIEELKRECRNFLGDLNVGTSEEDKEIFDRSARSYMKTCKTFYGLVCPTLLVWFILPALYQSLPVRLWLPFETEPGSDVYVGAYVYEVILLSYFGAIVVSVDLILWSFIFLACAHLDVLAKNIEKIGTVSSSAVVGELQRHVGRCVRHHQQIFKVTEKIDSIFRWTNLIHFFGLAVLISVTEYDIIQKSYVLNLQMVRQLGNLCSAFFDLFVFCYYGSLLEEKSLKISWAVYDSPWLDLDPSSRRMLLLIMLRAQKKAKITAGKIFAVNLETYLTIVRNSYNLLAVLRQTKA